VLLLFTLEKRDVCVLLLFTLEKRDVCVCCCCLPWSRGMCVLLFTLEKRDVCVLLLFTLEQRDVCVAVVYPGEEGCVCVAVVYPGEEGCVCVAVSSECLVQLIQGQHHSSLVLVLLQGSLSDNGGVVVQGPTVEILRAPRPLIQHLLLLLSLH